jgi:beta-N-acetylhexosaminidase
VAVDQEGGRVNRITDGVTVFPSAAVLSGDVDAVREAGYVTGRQVADLGVNVVLAPVADVVRSDSTSFIGNRSYGDDPQVVAQMVEASVDGLQRSGVAAAVKHWPGHGGTEVDSHRELPVLDVTRDGWNQRDRLPFQAAIDHHVSIVLVGHLAVPSIDAAGAPATVSPVLIDELLRRDLGFDGVVMTDALNMGAVADIDRGRLVVEAVAAGIDVLLVPPDLATAYRALHAAVEDGEISEARLDQSVLRVLRLKDHLGLLN